MDNIKAGELNELTGEDFLRKYFCDDCIYHYMYARGSGTPYQPHCLDWKCTIGEGRLLERVCFYSNCMGNDCPHSGHPLFLLKGLSFMEMICNEFSFGFLFDSTNCIIACFTNFRNFRGGLTRIMTMSHNSVDAVGRQRFIEDQKDSELGSITFIDGPGDLTFEFSNGVKLSERMHKAWFPAHFHFTFRQYANNFIIFKSIHTGFIELVLPRQSFVLSAPLLVDYWAMTAKLASQIGLFAYELFFEVVELKTQVTCATKYKFNVELVTNEMLKFDWEGLDKLHSTTTPWVNEIKKNPLLLAKLLTRLKDMQLWNSDLSGKFSGDEQVREFMRFAIVHRNNTRNKARNPIWIC